MIRKKGEKAAGAWASRLGHVVLTVFISPEGGPKHTE